MDIRHILSLHSSATPRPPVAVGTYAGGAILATAGGAGNTVCLHNLQSSSRHELRGHECRVSALALSPALPLLCSASTDALLLWDLPVEGEWLTPKPLPLQAAGSSEVTHVCFSPGGAPHYLAVCREAEVAVFDVKCLRLDTTLVGHTAPVVCAAFSPHAPHTIVTASQDRTFKVWDLAGSLLLHQSAIVSSSPFLCVCVAPHKNLLATGTADGVLRVFDLAEDGRYCCLHKCELERELGKLTSAEQVTSPEAGPNVIQGGRPWQQSQDSHVTSPVDVSPAILGLHYWLADSPQEDTDRLHKQLSDAHISEVLRGRPVLLVVTQLALLALSAETLQVLHCWDLREPVVSLDGSSCSVSAVGSCSSFSSHEGVWCALGALFTGTVAVLRLQHTPASAEDKAVNSQGISVLSSVPLVSNSPLRAELTLRAKPHPPPSQTRRGVAGAGHSRSGGVSDQPLTFRSKVKSSGYSQPPRQKMFVPKTQSRGQSSSPQQRPTAAAAVKRGYPMTCAPTTYQLHSTQLTHRPFPVNSTCFTGGGQLLACACADNSTFILKMPPASGKVHTVVGHDGPVTSAGWSQTGERLVTGSADRTARLWDAGGNPLLTLDSSAHSLKGAGPPFAKEITHVQFYYMDRFLLVASGSTLDLYKYHIDSTRPDDIKRYASNTHYKLVTSLSVQPAQAVTALSAINDFHSYIVLAAASNKALSVFDMNVGRSVLSLPSAHSRPAHCLQLNKGSRFATPPPEAYDTFLTCAATDGIKLWDLRTARSVARFSGHVNQCQPVAACFSPCARYIATGSEDRAAYVYDIRSSSPLHKLSGLSEAVLSVCYHPLKPLLAAGTLDGRLYFFTDFIAAR